MNGFFWIQNLSASRMLQWNTIRKYLFLCSVKQAKYIYIKQMIWTFYLLLLASSECNKMHKRLLPCTYVNSVLDDLLQLFLSVEIPLLKIYTISLLLKNSIMKHIQVLEGNRKVSLLDRASKLIISVNRFMSLYSPRSESICRGAPIIKKKVLNQVVMVKKSWWISITFLLWSIWCMQKEEIVL